MGKTGIHPLSERRVLSSIVTPAKPESTRGTSTGTPQHLTTPHNSHTLREMTLEVTQLAESLGGMRLQQLVGKIANSAIQGITEGVIQRQRA